MVKTEDGQARYAPLVVCKVKVNPRKARENK